MTNANGRISESDRQAFVDGRLDEARRAEVGAYLDAHPEEAERVAAYRAQNAALHALFDPILEEEIPPAMRRPARPQWRLPLARAAAAAFFLVLGGGAGWWLHGVQGEEDLDYSVLGERAAEAHAVYTPEVRHPVEVAADQEAHLVGWLSKRLGAPIRAPNMNEVGFELVGGRLLPGAEAAAAQLMYENARGERLTLYLRGDVGEDRHTAFRYMREDVISVFFWIDGPLGYALVGSLEKPELLEIANLVYRQLNP